MFLPSHWRKEEIYPAACFAVLFPVRFCPFEGKRLDHRSALALSPSRLYAYRMIMALPRRGMSPAQYQDPHIPGGPFSLPSRLPSPTALPASACAGC